MAQQLLKRLIPLLAGVGITAAAASNVVSCVDPQYAVGEPGQRIVVATDGGNIHDHSFNEDAFDGVKNFMKDAYGLSANSDYVEAAGADTTSIVTGYRLAVYKKANAIILPGFSHVNTLPQALPMFHEHNINVVLVDGITEDPNVISIQFNSQLSGVMAGFDTSFEAGTNVAKYDTNGDGKIKIGTFAGSSNKYGVDNYMWGLLLGMQMYNDALPIIKAHKEFANAQPVYSANVDSGNVKDIQTSGPTDSDFYTQSFALGDATKSGIIGNLVAKRGADIIFPVAGPQIQDVLSYEPTNGNKSPFLIGVDVDQEAAYANEAFRKDGTSRFITAAIKNIDKAVPEALYRASRDDNSGNTLIPDSKVNPSDTYGGWSKDDNNDDNHWLGKAPSPRVDWSKDYTDTNVPNDPNKNRYLLKYNHIKLYDPKDTLHDAQAVGAKVMELINSHFAALGPVSQDYMNGNDIFNFAQELINKYLPAANFKKDSDEGNSWVADFYDQPSTVKAGDDHE